MYARAAADAREDAVWSARRDTLTGYGIAVFDVDPGDERDSQTSITVRYFHALGADPVNPTTGAKGAPSSDYTEFESFTLARPRADRDHGKRAACGVRRRTMIQATAPGWDGPAMRGRPGWCLR